MPPGDPLTTANQIAASQFVALVLALVVLGVLFWLYVRALNDAREAWKQVGDLSGALKDNNTLVRELLDRRERRGARA